MRSGSSSRPPWCRNLPDASVFKMAERGGARAGAGRRCWSSMIFTEVMVAEVVATRFLRDRDAHAIIGGLWGHSVYDWFLIERLFVNAQPDCRRRPLRSIATSRADR